MPGQTVTVVAEHDMSDARKAIGWQTPDCSPAHVILNPNEAEIASLIGQENKQPSVHLLHGLVNAPFNRRVLPRLARSGAIVGLISESADPRGIYGLARRAKYSFDRHIYEKHLDFILAMGQRGVQWYKSAGYDDARIYPFAYVTEKPDIPLQNGTSADKSKTVRILYLGRIIALKDVVTGIRALARISSLDWRFDVVGDGPDLPRCKTTAAEVGIEDRVRFHPIVDNSVIGSVFEKADLLLFPSSCDGWGAVVNEALMCGVPVVCSDQCGAADLLRKPLLGSIFKAGSVEGLQVALKGWIERGRRNKDNSAHIQEWSSAIEGTEVAKYVIEIVKHFESAELKPSPPWY
jgi:glycosyltransferase involved in cell wall biosynthesis